MLPFFLACFSPTPAATDDPEPLDPADTSALAVEDTSDTAPPAEAPRCEPVAELAEAHYLEGDTITFSFRCTSGAERSEFSASLVSLHVSPVLDLDTWQVTWLTDLDDGGKHDLVLSVSHPGGGALETASITLWIADNFADPDNVPPDPATYTEEWGLPVVHVEPTGSVSDAYVGADITFLGQSYTGQIKKRGATSYYYPKNSFTLRFPEEDLDADAVGLGNKDHLVLISPFDDNSYVRQKLAYDLWYAMAEHWGEARLTPRTFFAVLYLEGSYYGLYTAIDRIDEHFLQEMGFEREANLYMAVNHDANFYLTNSSGGAKSTLHDGYEKEEGDPADFSDIEALVSFTGNATPESFVASADEWLDLQEFMDWFLLVHYTSSDDSGGKNSFLYNETAADPYFRYAPWDFNHSFGQGWYTYRISADVYNDFQWNNRIFYHILNHPDASAELWERFASLTEDGPLNDTWLTSQVDSYYALIGPSAERDWAVWADSYDDYFGPSNSNSYWQEREYLYQWIQDRHAAMLSYHPTQ